MVTEEELLNAGFKRTGEWNNRIYYNKGGFELVDHFGIWRSDEHNWSGFGEKLETIEEVNSAFNEWAKEIIVKCDTEIALLHSKKKRLESVLC